jgi:hypothetical protein
MTLRGRIDIGPYGADSKSARAHQAFLVTGDGQRLLLRRHDGPSMRDGVLEAMAGREVIAEGLLRGTLFIATDLRTVDDTTTAPGSGTAPSASGGRVPRKP